jgi:hypothetical protein
MNIFSLPDVAGPLPSGSLHLNRFRTATLSSLPATALFIPAG